jgi:hypothetical protein
MARCLAGGRRSPQGRAGSGGQVAKANTDDANLLRRRGACMRFLHPAAATWRRLRAVRRIARRAAHGRASRHVPCRPADRPSRLKRAAATVLAARMPPVRESGVPGRRAASRPARKRTTAPPVRFRNAHARNRCNARRRHLSSRRSVRSSRRRGTRTDFLQFPRRIVVQLISDHGPRVQCRHV